MKFELDYEEVERLYDYCHNRCEIIGNTPFKRITEQDMDEYSYLTEMKERIIDWKSDYKEWENEQMSYAQTD